jgi:hypothetical protein
VIRHLSRVTWRWRSPCATVWLLLAAAGCAPQVIWSGHDPQRQLKAEVLASGGQQWMRTGRQQGSPFDRIASAGIVFAPEGSKVAYAALQGGTWWFVLGTEMLGPWEGVADPRFSRDGSRFAFAAQTPAGWHVVVDERIGAPFESIQSRTLHFSEDGTHVAYVARIGPCAFIVVDGRQGVCRERIRSLSVTDGGTVAAVVHENSQEHFLFGTTEGPPVDSIGDWTVTDDGRHFAYAARIGQRWTAVVDGVGFSACGRVQHLRFGDEGRRAAWVCVKGRQSSVVIDGTEGTAFPVVSAPVLAAVAPDYAYVAHDERGAWVVAADSMRGPFAEVDNLLLSNHGGVLAFLARVDGQTRVVHGAEQTQLSAVVKGSLVLSEDGHHWAVIDGDPTQRVLWLLVDGTKVKRVAPEEVFGQTAEQLAPWLERELRETSSTALRKQGR